MGLTKIAISRPVFIVMLMCAAVLMGLISYRSMRVEQNPDVTFGVVTITTVYPGAGPDEINTLVTRPIEEAVSSVANLQEVTSTSQEGASSVVLRFEIGADQEAALNDVRAKVDAVIGQLPRDVDKPIVEKFDTASSPVMTLSVKSQRLSNRQLRDLAEDKLQDRFARIKGVAQVEVGGGDVREIEVQLKKDALEAYKLGIVDVQRALQAATLNVPSGRIVTKDQEYTVRVLGEFKSVDEIGQTWLTFSSKNNDGPNKSVRLSDIARIVDTNVERRAYSRLNGADAVTINIQKAKAGNAVEISDAILKPQVGQKLSLLKSLEQEYGLQFVVTQDDAKNIRESLADLQFALVFGIVLVMAVVWLFLHNLRGMFIVALAIPICMIASFIFMNAAGFTVNSMSMLALSLAVGVLVDDAIVVIENIYRHLTMGEDPVEAAINGRSEIGLAAIAITLADVVVWVPIGTMGGIVGQFFKPLGLGFASTVLLSLFVSFTVVPMLASRWYRSGEDWEHPKGGFPAWFETTFHSFALRYRRVLEWSLRHRWYVFGTGWVVLFGMFQFIGGTFAKTAGEAVMGRVPLFLFCLVIGAIVFAANIPRRHIKPQFILYGAIFGAAFPSAAYLGWSYAHWKQEAVFKFAFSPPTDNNQVQITIDLPPGASLERTADVVSHVEQIVLKNPEAKYVISRIGSRAAGFAAAQSGTNYAAISVTLFDKAALLDDLLFWVKHSEHLRRVSDTEVAADMLQAIGKVPGAKVLVSAVQGFGFGSPIQMSFRSDDQSKLLPTVVKIRDALAAGAIKGVITPDISSKPGKPEVRAIPDRAKMADVGITTADIGAALRIMYEGDNTTKYRSHGREYDIRVMMDRKDRDNAQIVDSVPVAFKDGNPIYLSEVANLNYGQGIDKIDRRDRQEEVTLSTDLLPGYAAGTVQAQIDQWLKDNEMIPEGVSYKPLGQADVQARESGYLFGAFMIGLVLVYMLLAALFNNYVYPLIIQLAQPQALVGALLALIFTDKTLNIVGFVGIIALVGLVGKNAILLVDFANTLRSRGEDRHTALCDSGQTRLRPIMMTTMALLFGMLPVALAIGRGSEFRETIGITIIGGVLLSTLLTLLIIPCSYTLFDDFSEWINKVRGRPSSFPSDIGTPNH